MIRGRRSDGAASGPDMTGRVVLITGGNSGIGKETAVGLASLGASVTIASRNQAKGEEAVEEIRSRAGNADVSLGSLDLGSLGSVREFAGRFLADHPALHVLVNNAGLITSERRLTVDGFEEMFGVNHLGHFLLTNLLLDRLKESAPSRIVVVSSVVHRLSPRGLRFDDLQSERDFSMFRTYGRSKLANAMHAMELARRLEGTGVTVNCLHPGTIRSGFGGDGDTRLLGRLIEGVGRVVMASPTAGARTPVMLASSDDERVAGTSGGYYSHGRRWRPSRAARDAAAARRLWEESERMVAERALRS
jgi:NAD(P)-dependent dehydrogenase (short-subunit alcohol dehydrogenase family)